MSTESKRAAKTMTLSLRLDPKTRFILEFVARIKGQSITTVVERAIKEMANGLSIGPGFDERGNPYEPKWSDFWDPSEGVRMLRLLLYPEYPTTYDEDETKQFALVHWPFFYMDRAGNEPHRDYLEILWPNVDHYMQIWRQKKRTDYWAAGEAMKADLTAARVAGPHWPPKAESRPDPADVEILAYRIQELAFGGLSACAEAKLKALGSGPIKRLNEPAVAGVR